MNNKNYIPIKEPTIPAYEERERERIREQERRKDSNDLSRKREENKSLVHRKLLYPFTCGAIGMTLVLIRSILDLKESQTTKNIFDFSGSIMLTLFLWWSVRELGGENYSRENS